jgi:hypothetical protein
LEEKEIKFGNKDFGRTPIERMIILLEKKGMSRLVINLLFLFILIGINAQIHNETTKGVQFLIIVFLILFSGNESTTNFFGAATLAIFIIIHLSMFGFNSLALISTFIVFLIFKKNLEKNFLGPISIYLIIDTLFIYFNLHFTEMFNSISKFIFSRNVLILFSIMPATYLFLNMENRSKMIFSNSFFKKYSVFIFLGSLFGIIFLTGIIVSSQAIIYISLTLFLFYALGTSLYQNEPKKHLFLILPIGLILVIAYILKRFFLS